MTNDRHYYTDGEDQLWRIAPGEPPRAIRRRRLAALQIWGMGIASHDLTGDGYPEVVLTSQGDNKLQTLADGPAQTHLPRHRAPRGARLTALRRGRRAAVDGLAPGVRRCEQRRSSTSSSRRAMSRHSPTSRRATRTTCSSRSATARSSRAPPRPASSASVVRGAALVDLNLDGMLDLVVVHRSEPVGLFRNVGSGTASSPHRWAIGSRSDFASRRRIDAIGAWIEVQFGEARSER